MAEVSELERLIESQLTIPDKQNRVIAFRLWKAQRHFIRSVESPDPPRRRVHLKSRQTGRSSIIVARNALHAMSRPNFTVLVVCQDEPTRELFRYHYKLHWEDMNRLGKAPQIGADNKDMLVFDILGSRILFETAEGQGVGRAWTINRLHATEVAHWKHPGATLTGAIQSVPATGEVDIESTPLGAGGPFHRVVQAALRGRDYGDCHWELYFYPWWETEEYITGDDSPLDDLTEHEAFLIAKHNLSFAHIRWRRSKVAELAVSDDPFEQEYPEDELSCFLGGRHLLLKPEAIKRLIRDIREPIAKVNPADPKKGGNLWVWKEPRPNEQYLIPADISEGVEQDYFAAPVINYRTCEVVAAYYSNRVDPIAAARILKDMGKWYNDALVAPETHPGVGYTTGKELENKWIYPNLYYHMDPAHPDRVGDVGWRTDARTRPLIQGALLDFIPTGVLVIPDERAVNELSALVWHKRDPESGARPKLEAVPGEHDDYAMALGIGLVVRDMMGVYQERPAPQRGRIPLRMTYG